MLIGRKEKEAGGQEITRRHSTPGLKYIAGICVFGNTVVLPSSLQAVTTLY